MMEIMRKKELKKLLSLKDEKIIKILIGTRRVGKSTTLYRFKIY
jgi:predicted AAA+ superfamily ATPase